MKLNNKKVSDGLRNWRTKWAREGSCRAECWKKQKGRKHQWGWWVAVGWVTEWSSSKETNGLWGANGTNKAMPIGRTGRTNGSKAEEKWGGLSRIVSVNFRVKERKRQNDRGEWERSRWRNKVESQRTKDKRHQGEEGEENLERNTKLGAKISWTPH